MHIDAGTLDRAKFLLLTAAIASANTACSPALPSELPEASSTSNAAPAPTPEAPKAAPAPTQEAAVGGAPGEGRSGRGPAREGRVDPFGDRDGVPDDAGGPSQEGGARTQAPATNGYVCAAVGKIPDCTTLRAPGPQCESFSDTKNACVNFSSVLQPKVAEKAVACIVAKSGSKGICDFELASKCAEAAVKAAGCTDPGVAQTCTKVAALCAKQPMPRGQRRVTLSSCTQALSAVTSPTKRNEIISSMTEGCIDGGIGWMVAY